MNQTIKSASIAIIAVAIFAIAVVQVKTYLDNKEKEELINNYDPNDPANPDNNVIGSLPVSEITYDEMEFDFGIVESGTDVHHSFAFTNTGKNPLLISKAKGSCGCTVPSYPQHPIPPGGKGSIDVTFNSEKGGIGNQVKTVTVTANTNPVKSTLTIKAQVVAPPDGQ